MKTLLKTLVVSSFFFVALSFAQSPIKVPDVSPAATVMQTVGISEITVAYGRPAVNGRKIWGQLVAYGETWRAGANANTTISFSSDVTFGGKPVKAGTYGLHMIPTAKEWTVILSNASNAWGSYSYDVKEDAARVTVTPVASAVLEERLSFSFENLSATQAVLVMKWEKLSVPVKIEVDTNKVVMERAKGVLRGVAGFYSDPWYEAGQYAFFTANNLDEALKFVDKSIESNAVYKNLMLRSAIVAKKGNAADAAETKAKAQAIATENDAAEFAYGMLEAKKVDEAISAFQECVQKFPNGAYGFYGLGNALMAKNDKVSALAAYEKSFGLMKDSPDKKRLEKTIAKMKQK
jgi:tetratricopeptide (TPR) repeat protein